jgi:hypothetical protein
MWDVGCIAHVHEHKLASHLLSLSLLKLRFLINMYMNNIIIRINKNRIPETKITEGSPSRNITRKIDHDPHKLRIIYIINIHRRAHYFFVLYDHCYSLDHSNSTLIMTSPPL